MSDNYHHVSKRLKSLFHRETGLSFVGISFVKRKIECVEEVPLANANRTPTKRQRKVFDTCQVDYTNPGLTREWKSKMLAGLKYTGSLRWNRRIIFGTNMLRVRLEFFDTDVSGVYLVLSSLLVSGRGIVLDRVPNLKKLGLDDKRGLTQFAVSVVWSYDASLLPISGS